MTLPPALKNLTARKKAMIEAAGWGLTDLKRLKLIPKYDP